jgi:hypothetical protein
MCLPERASTVKSHDLAEIIVDINGESIRAECDSERPDGDRGRVAAWSRSCEALSGQSKKGPRWGRWRSYEWFRHRLVQQ